MDTTIRRSSLFGFVIFLVSAALASAHSFLPATAGQSITLIPDISVSRAAYRELARPGQVDIYEFAAKKGQEIYIQLTVPVLDRLSSFAPDLALVYTGEAPAAFDSPALQSGTLVDPDHEVVDSIHPHAGDDEAEPALVGAAFDRGAPVVFDEPVTGTRYWIRQTLTVTAPADGTYRIGVWSPDGATGKYVLAPGKREAFGIGDIVTLPSVRIQVRQFCEQPVWGDFLVDGVLVAAAVTGVVLLAAALL